MCFFNKYNCTFEIKFVYLQWIWGTPIKTICADTMKLVIMTKSTFFVEEDKILASLFDEGLDALHLSKPGSAPMLCERLLTLLPDECHRRITVHEHYYLKNEYSLAGIHIDNMDEEKPQGYRGNISRTCSSIDRLKEMKKKSQYVFLANVFKGDGMNGHTEGLSIQELENASRKGLIDKHVYALGGVQLDNIRMARDLGFGGVVVCDDLWNQFDIHRHQDYKELIAHFEKLKKAVG